MRRTAGLGLVAVLAAAAALAGVAAISAQRPEPEIRGADEVYYLDAQGLALQPGDSWKQALTLQNPDLSMLEIPYRLDSGTPARVHVRVALDSGRVLADGDYDLQPTPAIDSPETWIQSTFWGPVARYRQIAVARGAAAEPAELTVGVPADSKPVTLWWNYLDPATAKRVAYPEGVGPGSTPRRALAVETGYGTVRPALAQAPLMESRVARLAPPWLPEPAPWILLAGVLAGGVAVAAWTAAGAGSELSAPTPPAGPPAPVTEPGPGSRPAARRPPGRPRPRR